MSNDQTNVLVISIMSNFLFPKVKIAILFVCFQMIEQIEGII